MVPKWLGFASSRALKLARSFSILTAGFTAFSFGAAGAAPASDCFAIAWPPFMRPFSAFGKVFAAGRGFLTKQRKTPAAELRPALRVDRQRLTARRRPGSARRPS